MATETEIPTKERSISGMIFPITMPFAEGHVCTAAEAAALNQTRAENIGNNVRLKIKTALAAEEGSEGYMTEAEISAMVAERDAEYVFTLVSVGSGRKTLDPLEKECLKLAREILHNKIHEAGHTLKDYKEAKPDAYEENLAKIAENEQVVKLAKQNIKNRESVKDISI